MQLSLIDLNAIFAYMYIKDGFEFSFRLPYC